METKYKYEYQNGIDGSWSEITKITYDNIIDKNYLLNVRKVPIDTITEPTVPDQPKPDYESALKYVMEVLLCDYFLENNINIGDLLADLKCEFNIDLKIKIE